MDEKFHWKENVLQYCRSWFKDGLQDRAVTRDLDWGIPVPLEDAKGKVLYVWFEAVLGYISAAKELSEKRGEPDLWKNYWQDPNTKYVAFIGKDNVVFHTIFFPAMLMAWNDGREDKYVLPQNVPANEFYNFEGKKFSKSRNWGIDVIDFLKVFPAIHYATRLRQIYRKCAIPISIGKNSRRVIITSFHPFSEILLTGHLPSSLRILKGKFRRNLN